MYAPSRLFNGYNHNKDPCQELLAVAAGEKYGTAELGNWYSFWISRFPSTCSGKLNKNTRPSQRRGTAGCSPRTSRPVTLSLTPTLRSTKVCPDAPHWPENSSSCPYQKRGRALDPPCAASSIQLDAARTPTRASVHFPFSVAARATGCPGRVRWSWG